MGRKFKMFRYLEKYVGTYRVKAPYDEHTGDFPKNAQGNLDTSFDDLYIPCARGVIKHTYEDGILCWQTDSLAQFHNVLIQLKDCIYSSEEFSGGIIYFEERYIDRVVKIVGAKTAGKNYPPYSKWNLPKIDYTIPSDDLKKYTSLFEGKTSVEKMHLAKNLIKDFDKVIIKEKGEKHSLAKNKYKLNIGSKEYIHSLGLWDKFISSVEKYLKNNGQSKSN